MKPSEYDKDLDELITRTVGREKPTFDFDKWKQNHQKEIRIFKQRTVGSRVTYSDQPFKIWRKIMKSRITKLAAAAVIVIAVLVGLNQFGISIDGTSKVYAMSDLPALFKESSTIYIQGLIYFPGHRMPDGRQIPPVEMEQCVDLENGRVRFTGVGLSISDKEVIVNIGETISDGEYKLFLSHTNKPAVFFKISNYQRMLETHYSLSQMFAQMFGDVDKVDDFVKIGQEEIEGVEYEIWESDVAKFNASDTERYKYWLSPLTGESARVQAWAKLDEEQWALDYEYRTILRDVEIPDEVFSLNVPEEYNLKNTKETATLLELDDGGSVHYSSLTFDPRISFTMSDGSVIVGWHSIDKEAKLSQERLFEKLEFGGQLPKLPVEMYGLKPNELESDVTYWGYHLTYTQKNGKLIEWSLYVPDGLPGAGIRKFGYDVLYKFNLGEKDPKWKIGYTVAHGILIETIDDFDRWVLGAMAELSDDGIAPEHVTYESVLELAEKVHDSLHK